MNLAEKQAAWVERYGLIADPQERLAAIVGRRSALEPLRAEERRDEFLVPGCVSRVWLGGEVRDGVLRLRVDAEAALVRGLAAWLAEFYDGAIAVEAAAFETTLLTELGLARSLTPTRAHGLGRVVARIRALAGAAGA